MNDILVATCRFLDPPTSARLKRANQTLATLITQSVLLETLAAYLYVSQQRANPAENEITRLIASPNARIDILFCRRGHFFKDPAASMDVVVRLLMRWDFKLNNGRLLIAASRCGYLCVVNTFLKSRDRVPFDAVSAALLCALYNRHEALVEPLLLYRQKNDWVTMKHWKAAVRTGNTGIMQLLVNQGLGPDVDYQAIMHEAMSSLDDGREMLRFLLDARPGVDMAHLASHALIVLKHPEPIVAMLLDRGAPLNGLLVQAVIMGRHEVTELLLHKGADVHEGLDAALITAVGRGKEKTVLLLLDHGADVHAQGESALRSAAEAKNFFLTHLLLSRGADPARLLKSEPPVCCGGQTPSSRCTCWYSWLKAEPYFEKWLGGVNS
ncbi:hypothetical protein HK104_009978 [Borealophlyctis nickersoniae]|nr:hypothetical protein HK104_009978 [Borealophlyctis nickersoniae]